MDPLTLKQKEDDHHTSRPQVCAMSKMSDLQEFRVRTPSFLMIAENPAQVWHTSILNKLDQVVATSYTRNPAQVSHQIFQTFSYFMFMKLHFA